MPPSPSCTAAGRRSQRRGHGSRSRDRVRSTRRNRFPHGRRQAISGSFCDRPSLVFQPRRSRRTPSLSRRSATARRRRHGESFPPCLFIDSWLESWLTDLHRVVATALHSDFAMASFVDLLRQHPDQLNALVGLAALIVLLLAIVLTVVSLYWSRQHDHKSLTPIASIPVSNYEDKVAVKIRNTGVGPMIIDTFRASNGRRTEDDLISLMPELPNGVLWDTFFDDLDGACIPPGEHLGILQLSRDSNDRNFARARDACRRALVEVTVVVKFRDIYARPMPTLTKFWAFSPLVVTSSTASRKT